MIFLIWLATILGYFTVGLIAARIMFVSTLGDSPRRTGNIYRRTSYEYDEARTWAGLTFCFWLPMMFIVPVAWGVKRLAGLVIGPTPYEKEQRRAKIAEQERKDLEAAARRANLPLADDKPGTWVPSTVDIPHDAPPTSTLSRPSRADKRAGAPYNRKEK